MFLVKQVVSESLFPCNDISNVSKKRDKGPMHQVLCRQTAHILFRVQYLAVSSEIQRTTLCSVLTGHKKDAHVELSSNIRAFTHK
jgi:hypothetical protein